ncbi:MAG: MFS transporter [Acidobacteria bacterium]|nr:MFS transporter [Acidobacteriota bacterium]
MLARVLRPIVQLRHGEGVTALLMFLYSFLAMTSYNIVKPITRSEFIASLGVDNLPWVQFTSGIVIGLIMQAYSRVIAGVPRRWMIPVTQAGMVVLLVLFWFLFTAVGAEWVSVGFYLLGLILGILLISQFWTLANDIYDPRQAKRLFGFIGGGSSLGGAMGNTLTTLLVESLGAQTMLLVSAAIMGACLVIVVLVVRREAGAGQSDASKTGEEERVSSGEAIGLLRRSPHLQVIAAVIGFAAIGAAIIEQQLNMAAAEAKGAQNSDAIAAFLSQIGIYLSLIGFFVQVVITSRIHRFLGIGFALLVLPVSLGSTAVVMLFNRALWAPGLARVLDTSLRYTVDKTSREILFLPLPADLKYRAKPFIDVTVDRFAKGLGALMILVLIKPWGFGWDWQQLSYASLTMMGLWVITAVRARTEYLRAFRRNLEQQDVRPADLRIDSADLSSIETLLLELAHHEPRRVIYAIDMLEALDKRQLVTPLLLRHDSADVRTRALRLARYVDPRQAERWLPGVERALGDDDGEVRLAAARALATLRGEAAVDVMRPYLDHADANLVMTAAAALASSDRADDVDRAEETFKRLAEDTRASAVEQRRQVARALGLVSNPRFRPLLVPLMYDDHYVVARAAVNSAGTIGGDDFLFVPTLVALMRNRRLKEPARKVLVGYGEAVVPTLAYFLADEDEDIWVRRHVPATLARIPSAASVQALLGATEAADGFLRFKAITALTRIRDEHPDIAIDSAAIERQVLAEAKHGFDALTLYTNIFVNGGVETTTLLARTLMERRQRTMARLFQLLGLIHPPGDMAAVAAGLRSTDARHRSGAAELLDNMLRGDVRRRVMLLVDEMPDEERVRRGNVLYRTRTRDLEDSIAQLVHDDNQVVAAAAVLLIGDHKLWSLTGDLEHVLAHRHARDLHVFEAASWALAASRMASEQRRRLWQEPLPVVVLADRLRRLPIFDFTSIDELFRIVSLGRQVRHDAGRAIYERGVNADRLQFLLDGRVALSFADGTTVEAAAPVPLAFDEIIEGRPMRAGVRAVDTSIALSIPTEDFLSLLAENVEMAEGIMRWLIDSRPSLQRLVVLHGDLGPELQRKVAAGLAPVDRTLLLQTSPLLARASGAQLLRLAACARPVALKAGVDPTIGFGDASMLVVLTGTVTFTPAAGDPVVADAGDVIGMTQVLSGKPLPGTMRAASDGTALRFTHGDVFDVLSDDTALLQAVFAGLRGDASLPAPSPVFGVPNPTARG